MSVGRLASGALVSEARLSLIQELSNNLGTGARRHPFGVHAMLMSAQREGTDLCGSEMSWESVISQDPPSPTHTDEI